MKKGIVFFSSLVLALSLTACNMASGMKDDINSGMSKVESATESTIDKASSAVDDFSITAEITADEAKRIALDHARLKEADVTDLDVDLDRDGSTLKYEVDFRAGNIEYDYDIDAKTGKIISADKDRD